MQLAKVDSLIQSTTRLQAIAMKVKTAKILTRMMATNPKSCPAITLESVHRKTLTSTKRTVSVPSKTETAQKLAVVQISVIGGVSRSVANVA